MYEAFGRTPRSIHNNPVARGLAPCIATLTPDKYVVLFIKEQQQASNARELRRLSYADA